MIPGNQVVVYMIRILFPYVTLISHIFELDGIIDNSD